MSVVHSQPTVSIVINNFNYARFIGAAIESAMAQTYDKIEVIVVDDGSNDSSQKIIDSYSNIIPVFKENGGQASAFTVGIEASRGDIVIFLDSDDMLLPQAAEVVVRELRDQEIIKAHWALYEINEMGSRTGRILPQCRKLLDGDVLPEIIQFGVPRNWGHGLGHAYRREILERILPIRESGDKHGADSYLCVLAPIFGQIRRVEEPLGCYRSHGANFARGKEVLYRLKRDAGRYPFFFHWIAHYLRERGIEADPAAWHGSGTAFAWTRDALALNGELDGVGLGAHRFVLVDDGLLGVGFYGNSVPMMEVDGEYAGPPTSDNAAIEELEKQRCAGADFIVFALSSSWWLDHYQWFNAYLREHYSCVHRSESMVVFDLRHFR